MSLHPKLPPSLDAATFLKTGCVMPFLGICLEAGGRYKPCCKLEGWQNEPNAKDVTLKELIQARPLEKLRQEFLSGGTPAACIRCFKDEEVGLPSMRQSYNEKYKDLFSEADISSPRIKIIDFGFGNLCNAACVNCNSVSSTLWIKDEIQLQSVGENQFHRHPEKVYRDDYIWTDEDLEQLHSISHAQNEVMIHPSFFKFINKVSSLDSAKDKIIDISTNGFVFPDEKIVDALLKFKTVEVQFSIDAWGEKNNYIRHPLEFKKIEENIQRWMELGRRHPQLTFVCRCTVNIYNVLYLQELVQWWDHMRQQLGRRQTQAMHFGYVWNPTYLSPVILPHAVKQLALERFSHPFLKNLLSRKRSSIPLYQQKQFPNPQKLFFEFTEKMDQLRSLDSQATFPLLFSHFSLEKDFSYSAAKAEKWVSIS